MQLHLGQGSTEHLLDTLVMSNLGYFQLKVAPGVWNMRLAPGRSRDLYAIRSSTLLDGSQRLSAQVSCSCRLMVECMLCQRPTQPHLASDHVNQKTHPVQLFDFAGHMSRQACVQPDIELLRAITDSFRQHPALVEEAAL